MVVSIDIFTILNVMQAVAAIAFLVFQFILKEKSCSALIRMVASTSIVVINAFLIPIYMNMGQSCAPSLLLLILWLIQVMVNCIQLGKKM